MTRKGRLDRAEERLQRWLGDVDEFGMITMVVLNGVYK
jgi:hypothetical protein